jgi:hypothetical protein
VSARRTGQTRHGTLHPHHPGGDPISAVLELVRPQSAWMRRAECRDLPDDIADAVFHPDHPDDLAALGLAARWCGNCPVAGDCHEYAMTGGNQGRPIGDGIWAGLGPAARRLLHQITTAGAA